MSFTERLKEGVKDVVREAASQKVTLELVAGYKNIRGKEITIYKGDGNRMFRFKTLGILGTTLEYEVIDISWQENAKRSAGKAAAGAIIGGALTGGIGVVAGAAIGGKRKDTSTAVITILDNGVESGIYVRCNAKQYEQLTRIL